MNGHPDHATRRVLAIVRHPVGGVRTHILYTYPLLMQAGYRFTFVIPEYEYHAPFVADVADWPGVEVVQVGHRDQNHQKPRFWSAVRKLIRQRRFSLVHSHGIQAAIPAVFANLGAGLPHVMTSQDVFCRLGALGRLDRLKLRVLQRVLRRLDTVVAVSEDTRSDHLHYLPGLSSGRCRVEVIPNGIELARSASHHGQAANHFRKKLALAPETRLLGFLGRFMPQKGFLTLVDALAALATAPDMPPWHLLAVGSGDYVREYRAEVLNREGLSSRVTFLEHVADVSPILQELDLLVMPSLWEACPILPMEAMVAGVPVLGTDCVGLREVLRGTPSVAVPANDSPALAAALRGALRSPWTDSARAYVPTARQRFDVQPVAERLGKLFDDLIGARSSGRGGATLARERRAELEVVKGGNAC
jgi:glycosyltransferase involved in cell wall biosynthesis